MGSKQEETILATQPEGQKQTQELTTRKEERQAGLERGSAPEVLPSAAAQLEAQS